MITGSTRGIGFGLADALLRRGCAVVVSGRTASGVEDAVQRLSAGGRDASRLAGRACDVTQFSQVQALWDFAAGRFGGVDIWINNAGLGQGTVMVWDLPPDVTAAVIQTNVTGTLHGCAVAVRGMLAQGSGAIFNLEGMGSDGRIVPGVSVYGTSKYAVKYLTDALVKETRTTGLVVGAIRPGMVVTDLITGPYRDRPEEWEKVKGIFSILSDRVETVSPWIADRILATTRTGTRIRWLTATKLLLRFLSAPLVKRSPFDATRL